MTPKFQSTLHQKDDLTYVKLSGVIDEDNELPNRFLDARIARGSGTPIGISKPPQPHGGPECFQVAIGTIRRAVGDHDDFISVRRVCLLL